MDNLDVFKTYQKIKRNYIFAVIRGESKEDAIRTAKAIQNGGIHNLEITFTTPKALSVIEELSLIYKNSDVCIGAGTVLDPITARLAMLAGAEFIVSPHFDVEIAKICNLYTIPYFPGCATVNEIMEAMRYGSKVVKIFPGSLLTPQFIQNVKAPLPNVEMMPSGGVSLHNIEEWMNQGAWAVGIGSDLSMNKCEDYNQIREKAEAYASAVDRFKDGDKL